MNYITHSIYKQFSLLLTSISLILVSQSIYSKGLGQKVTLDPLVVTSDGASGSLTSPSISEAREQLERIPGGIGFVDPEEYLDDFAQSIGDALLFTPGVFADTSAQRENRISIRGSGLNSSFERRGITVLRDGVPITRASGSTEFQEIDPLSVRYIEVFKGANGLQFGSSSLGGAINIVTPTGINAKQNLSARIEGGSFETVRANASVAGQAGDFDYFLGATGLRSDGFRDHSNVKSAYGFSNFGYQFSENLETRFYFTALTDNFQLAGGLPFETARSNPRSTRDPVVVGPPGGPSIVLDAGPIGDDWDRNLDVYRVANRTVAKFDAFTVEGGAWYSFRNLDHAITRFAGIIDQNEDEVGVYGRGYGDVDLGFATVDWTLGMQVNYGDNNARRLENDFGARGPLRSRSNQESENYITYAQADIRFIKELGFIVGGQYIRSQRENIAKVNDTSGKASFSQWSPRVGVLWDVTEDAQVFFNANRGFEPPSMSDLTAGGALDFTPLKA
ncbi:MAG: TonB-dependent receptor [Gammaproteobacteria bacterium]|nr:TonB-dependent receptor [Gammaproteobacteria bacterium]